MNWNSILKRLGIRRSRRPANEQDDHEQTAAARKKANKLNMVKVIKDAMTDRGVLGADYQFKLVAMDTEGLNYMVLIDMIKQAREIHPSFSNLLDGDIKVKAKSLYGFSVSGIYWQFGVENGGFAHVRFGSKPRRPAEVGHTTYVGL